MKEKHKNVASHSILQARRRVAPVMASPPPSTFPLYEYGMMSLPGAPCYVYVVPGFEGPDRTGAIVDVLGRARVAPMHTAVIRRDLERGPDAWLSAARFCKIVTEGIHAYTSPEIRQALQRMAAESAANAREESEAGVRALTSSTTDAYDGAGAGGPFVMFCARRPRNGLLELVLPVPDTVAPPPRGGRRTRLTGVLHYYPSPWVRRSREWRRYVFLHVLVHAEGMDCSFELHPREDADALLSGAEEEASVDGPLLRRMVDTAAESTTRAEDADMYATMQPLPEDLFALHVPNLLRRIDGIDATHGPGA